MDKRQYIAEHLDPMDTVTEWQSGEAFADTILENADGELPVTRDDLIDYWQDAREREQGNSSDPRTITIVTNVNQEFTAGGFEWRVDEDGDLMVILEGGSYVIDYVMEPTWSTWQDADTIPDFAVTITPEHVALAEELYAEVTDED